MINSYLRKRYGRTDYGKLVDIPVRTDVVERVTLLHPRTYEAPVDFRVRINTRAKNIWVLSSTVEKLTKMALGVLRCI